MRAKPMLLRGKNRMVAAAFCSSAAGIAVSLAVAPDWHGVFGAGLAVIMCVIAAIDARYFIIPDELSIAAIVLALAAARLEPAGSADEVAWAVARGAVLALLFLILKVAYRAFRKKDGVGMGDVKLAGVAGVWLGWQTAAITIEFAALSALISYTVCCCLFKRSLRTNAFLPFGLFFAPAIWLGWLIEAVQISPP